MKNQRILICGKVYKRVAETVSYDRVEEVVYDQVRRGEADDSFSSKDYGDFYLVLYGPDDPLIVTISNGEETSRYEGATLWQDTRKPAQVISEVFYYSTADDAKSHWFELKENPKSWLEELGL